MRIGSGTVAVITGGASGIGRSCATEFARRGADVVIADVNADRTAETVKALESLGGRVLGVHCDVTSDIDVQRLRGQAISAMGHVDLIMNNAGVALLGPPEHVPMDEWQRIFDVNVFGIIRGTQAFVPHFRERGSGYVVNTASVAGLYAYSWDSIPYITSKFGAYGFSEGLYVYLKPLGIGVSVLCPGLVNSNFGETARFAGLADPTGWVHLPDDMASIDAEVVGPIVADAVEQERFLVYTHPEDEARLIERRGDIEGALKRQVARAPRPPDLSQQAAGAG
jgi:NAD(P)-dependent dehydrogenase (short-subunit alcohol dehydrogenase family)